MKINTKSSNSLLKVVIGFTEPDIKDCRIHMVSVVAKSIGTPTNNFHLSCEIIPKSFQKFNGGSTSHLFSLKIL